MAIRQINPYLNFDGDAAKAAKLYESALGAKIEHISRFGDMPGSDAKPETKDRVMHASLSFGKAGTIMMSDIQPGAVSKDELATRIANMRECGATVCDTVAEEG